MSTAQAVRSVLYVLACPTSNWLHLHCVTGTAWAAGNGVFVTAAHVLRQPSTDRPYVELHDRAGVVWPAGTATVDDMHDVAIVTADGPVVPALPIASMDAPAGLAATIICDPQATAASVSTPSAGSLTFTGTTGAVIRPGYPGYLVERIQIINSLIVRGCSGAPVLVAGKVVGIAVAIAGSPPSSTEVVPISDVFADLATCGGRGAVTPSGIATTSSDIGSNLDRFFHAAATVRARLRESMPG